MKIETTRCELINLQSTEGYGTEAVQAVVTHAVTVLGLPRIIAETQIANIASCRLLESIGMRLEQTIERFGAKQGIFTTDLGTLTFDFSKTYYLIIFKIGCGTVVVSNSYIDGKHC